MEIGDKVYTNYVSYYGDKGPCVLCFERRVVAVLDSGIVTEGNGITSIHKHGEVFESKAAAAASAAVQIGDKLIELQSAFQKAMDRLLTADVTTV
jgi:hypothetical protein